MKSLPQNEPFSGSAVYVAPLLRYPHPYNETHKVQSIKGTFFRIEGWIWARERGENFRSEKHMHSVQW